MGSSSLIYIPKEKPNAAIRIICFPYAGGSSATYLPWVNLLPPDTELAVVQLPGRGARLAEPPYQTMHELVKNLLAAFEKLSQKPCIFFGHSMGARVAYELMLILWRFHYQLPLHFVASGSAAPFIPREEQTYHLPDDQFIEKICDLNGTPKEVLGNPELVQLVLPALRADFKIIETYCNESRLVIPTTVSVLVGDQDTEVNQEDAEGWLKLFETNKGKDSVSGDHFFIDKNRTDTINIVTSLIESHLLNLSTRGATG